MSTQSLYHQLETAASGLRESFSDTESRFLAVGGTLSETVAVFTRLTATFESLPCELERDEIGAAANRLRTVAGEVARIGVTLAAEQEAMVRLGALNRTLGACIAQLAATIRTISILAVNAQIASATISTDRQNFLVFTGEIARLTKTVATTIGTYSTEHKKLESLLGSAASTQAQFGRQHRQLLTSVAERLEASLAVVDARRTGAAAAAIEIGARTKQIGADIGVIVTALQIGDITRQRVEHIETALRGFRSSLPHPDTGAAALGADEIELAAAALSRLQSAQLEHATAEFEGEIARMSASLKRLSGDAIDIRRTGRDMFGSGYRRGESFLSDLENGLRDTGALIDKTQAARTGVDHVIATVGEALDGLLKHVDSVRGIEVDMRLVGLNMALRCGRLGNEGHALRAIAQELRGYAHQIEDNVGDLMAAVQALRQASNALASERQSVGLSETLKAEMESSLEAFLHGGERLGDALKTLSAGSADAGRLLGTAMTQLAQSDNTVRSMRVSQRHVDRIVALAPADCDQAVLDAALQAIGLGRYTMASERDIHNGLASFAIPGASAAESASADADDFLF